MVCAGATLLRISSGGREPGGAIIRRRRIAAVLAVAVLTPLLACQTYPALPPGEAEAQAREVRADLEAGLNLYESGDFELAAGRFQDAAAGARVCGDFGMERDATAAECTSWLRGRRLPDLSECTLRLEALQRRGRVSDPGVNTLLAMGAIAGDRSLPPFRVPTAVHPIVRAAAKE